MTAVVTVTVNPALDQTLWIPGFAAARVNRVEREVVRPGGKGVNVATVQREHSEFLTREASTTKSIAAADEARSSQLQQLEKVFPLGEAGLGYASTQMFNALVDVANKPSDTSSRQVVLARAGEFASKLKTAGE